MVTIAAGLLSVVTLGYSIIAAGSIWLAGSVAVAEVIGVSSAVAQSVTAALLCYDEFNKKSNINSQENSEPGLLINEFATEYTIGECGMFYIE